MNGSTNGFMVKVYTNYMLAMCNKDNDNLRGPFTKTLNLITVWQRRQNITLQKQIDCFNH